MTRVQEPSDELDWLTGMRGQMYCGFDAVGWPSSTWVLHALYEATQPVEFIPNTKMQEFFTGLHARSPELPWNLDIEAIGTYTPRPDGLEIDPGPPWRRVTWEEVLLRGDTNKGRKYPPCFQWFDDQCFPLPIQGASEGSLDYESFEALIRVLSEHSPEGDRRAVTSFRLRRYGCGYRTHPPLGRPAGIHQEPDRGLGRSI